MRDKIITERLILRSLENTDAPAFSKYCSNYNIAKMTGSIPHPFPLLSAEIKISLMKALKRNGMAHPYVITRSDDKMIGIVDIFRRTKKAHWELGYWLGQPFWGHGYAKEAMEALMKEATQALNIQTFIASIWYDNPSSSRVLEKLGFQAEGPNGIHYSMARLKKVQSLGYIYNAPRAEFS